MSNTQPIFIKNDAPRTVEVTPGSLDAKGKNNIVKQGEGTPSPHTIGETIQNELKNSVGLGGDASPHGQDGVHEHLEQHTSSVKIAQDSSPADKSHTVDAQHHIEQVNPILSNDLDLEKNTQKINDHAAAIDNFQKIGPGVELDHAVSIDPSKDLSHQDKMSHGDDANNSLHIDNTLSPSTQASAEHNNTTHDHVELLDQGIKQSNAQRLPPDRQETHTVSIDGSAIAEHQKPLDHDDKSHHRAGLARPTSPDHEVLLKQQAHEVNRQTIAGSTSTEREIEIPNPSMASSRVAIHNEPIADHRAVIHPEDQASSLHLVANPLALEHAVSSAHADAARQRHTVNSDQTRMLKELLEKKKKSDEFHGRVEAIRHSVNAVNARLEKIKHANDELSW